jgi:hypothetical protein
MILRRLLCLFLPHRFEKVYSYWRSEPIVAQWPNRRPATAIIETLRCARCGRAV